MATIQAIIVPSDPFAPIHSSAIQSESLLHTSLTLRTLGNLSAAWPSCSSPTPGDVNLMGTILCRAFALIGAGESCTGQVLLAGSTPAGSNEPGSIGPVLEALILGWPAS